MLRHVLQWVDSDVQFWPDIERFNMDMGNDSLLVKNELANIAARPLLGTHRPESTTAAKKYMPDNRHYVNNAAVTKLPDFQGF